jgi:hypothetical protein
MTDRDSGKPSLLFVRLKAESRVHGISIAQVAVDTLTIPEQMQEFLDGFANSLNVGHNPQRRAESLRQAIIELRSKAIVSSSHQGYVAWTEFLKTFEAPTEEPNASVLPPAVRPEQTE